MTGQREQKGLYMQDERMGENGEGCWVEFGKACQKFPSLQLSLNFKQQGDGGS